MDGQFIFLPLNSSQILQLILVHIVIWIPSQRFIDALQDPAALTQGHLQILLQTQKRR